MRKGNWIQTYTGIAFWPMDPKPEEVEIEDIAHALSNQCRYSGHSKRFYSVAQHSVLVSRALPKEFRLWGLLHDASEAFIVDVPSPIKPYLMGYEDIESGVMRVVCERFGLNFHMPEIVKRVDSAILVDEFKFLMKAPPRALNLPESGLGIEIDPWSPQDAKNWFLDTFDRLK